MGPSPLPNFPIALQFSPIDKTGFHLRSHFTNNFAAENFKPLVFRA